MRIMIIDDEECVRETLAIFAEMMGFKTTIASSIQGCEALNQNLCTCSNDTPCTDILIVDQNLPEMNGIDFLNKLKEMNCKLPVDCISIMSGNLMGSELEQVNEIGCNSFIKPVTYENLKLWLDDIVGRSGFIPPAL